MIATQEFVDGLGVTNSAPCLCGGVLEGTPYLGWDYKAKIKNVASILKLRYACSSCGHVGFGHDASEALGDHPSVQVST